MKRTPDCQARRRAPGATLRVVLVATLCAAPAAAFGEPPLRQAAGPTVAAPATAAHQGVCGACGPVAGDAARRPWISAVDCADRPGGESGWEDMRPHPFQPYGAGEYAGPARLAHLAAYRLRPGDEIRLIYLLTRRQTSGQYRLMVGDQVLIESMADEDLQRGSFDRGLEVQPDGTINVRLLGPVQAVGLTLPQLRDQLERRYRKYHPEPAIDVTPIRVNTLLEDIRDSVSGQSGLNPQAINVRVTPDGTIRLPKIGAVGAQGLTLEELKTEINLRYESLVVGLEVEPTLESEAPHFVYVLGEVAQPGRFQLQGPTSALGAVALAGGHRVGANLRQVVVFRRAEDWRLISTMLDLRGAVLGRRPTPADEIWVRDGDVIIVPAAPIERFNNFVQQVFIEGIYGIVPFGGVSYNLGNGFN